VNSKWILPICALVMGFGFYISNTNQASAQPGSRLCGIAFATTGILFEVKQPKGKGGRKKTNKICKKVSNELRDGLKKEGVKNADQWKYYQRSECEATAQELSKGKSRADICDQMERSGGKTVRLYTVQYDARKNSFSVTRLSK
jgi:hypothetical protein